MGWHPQSSDVSRLIFPVLIRKRDVMNVRMLNGNLHNSCCRRDYLLLSMASELVTFSARARGIKFYDIPLPNVRSGWRFCCELERHNARDANSICLKCSPTCTLGHLPREVSAHLAPLLQAGIFADG